MPENACNSASVFAGDGKALIAGEMPHTISTPLRAVEPLPHKVYAPVVQTMTKPQNVTGAASEPFSLLTLSPARNSTSKKRRISFLAKNRKKETCKKIQETKKVRNKVSK